MPAALSPSEEPVPPPASVCAQVLGALPEGAFGRVLGLARHLLELPQAAVHLSVGGLDWSRGAGEPPPGEAQAGERQAACLCSSGRREPGGEAPELEEDGASVWLVPDARRSARFREHPAVRAGEVVAYAGAPLLGPEGQRLGSLCGWGPQPRAFGAPDAETLRLLAGLVMDELELRRRAHELAQARDQARTLRDLAELTSEALAPPEIAQRALRLLARTMRLDWAGLLHLAPHAPRVLSDHPAAGGPRSSAYAGVIRQRLTAGSPLEETLLGWERVFLDVPLAVAGRCPELLTPDLGSAAWLHVQVGGEVPEAGLSELGLPGPGAPGEAQALPQGPGRSLPEGAHVLLLARLGEPAVWTPEERLLLEAAAQSVGVALERAGHVQALRRAALQDALTDLGNRRALDDALDDADRRWQQTGNGYALAVVDLDGMKRINDERGHASGDTLLREFGRALPGPGLSAYRLGGDEYAVLLTLRPGETPRHAAGTLRRQVEAAAGRVRALGYPADASLGVACVPGDAQDATAALREADTRMYAEKRAHRAAAASAARTGTAAPGAAAPGEAAPDDGEPRRPLPWRA